MATGIVDNSTFYHNMYRCYEAFSDDVLLIAYFNLSSGTFLLPRPQGQIKQQSDDESHLKANVTRSLGNRADIPRLRHARYDETEAENTRGERCNARR